MNIQELEKLADNGDVNAMVTLADEYYNRYQEEDFGKALEKALPWYTLAGRHSSVYGAVLCLMSSRARVLLAKENADWDAMSRYASEAIELCVEFMHNKILASSSVADESSKCIDACVYAIALSNYHKEDYEQAIEDLDIVELNSDYYGIVQILWGICLYDMDEIDDGAERLMILENDMKSILPKTPDAVDEEILERGTLYLALFYRLIENNLTKAYELIHRALSVIEDKVVRGILLEELTHYKKKLFGGYTYVK